MKDSGVNVALIGISDSEEEGKWVWRSGYITETEHISRSAAQKDTIPGGNLEFKQ